jgi:hypothetical protein
MKPGPTCCSTCEHMQFPKMINPPKPWNSTAWPTWVTGYNKTYPLCNQCEVKLPCQIICGRRGSSIVENRSFCSYTLNSWYNFSLCLFISENELIRKIIVIMFWSVSVLFFFFEPGAGKFHIWRQLLIGWFGPWLFSINFLLSKCVSFEPGAGNFQIWSQLLIG